MMWHNLVSKIRKFFQTLAELQQKQSFTPAYRLIEITKTETDEHIVTIQIINKSIVFQTKPEEILANDSLVDQFSPRDVRALTYLGYLSLNNPKYQILAQRLSEENDKVLFALRKKGEKKVVVKTADEILKEKEILNNLNAQDAHMVGYTIASENVLSENKLKEELSKNKQ